MVSPVVCFLFLLDDAFRRTDFNQFHVEYQSSVRADFIYTSLGKGKLLLARKNDFDREIKFVAKVDGVTVEHNYVEWNDSYFYPIETGFIIKPQKNVVYSFMGIVPEGIPEARLIISYKGEQKVVMIDWALEMQEDSQESEHYDVYF